MAQLVEALTRTTKGCGFNPTSGHIPRLGVWSLVGTHVGGNQLMFPSHIHLSLPHYPLSKINKHILKWGLQKSKCFFLFKRFLFIFKRGEGRKRREKHWRDSGCLLRAPSWRPGSPPRHVPSLGICLVTFGFIGLSHTSQGKMLISCSCYSPSWICWDSAAMSSPQEPGRETSTSNVAGPHSGRKKTLKDITPAIRYSSLQEIHITFVR